jgi:hypothetical protein
MSKIAIGILAITIFLVIRHFKNRNYYICKNERKDKKQ